MRLRLSVLALLCLLLLSAGCQLNGKPRIRLGFYPNTTIGTRFPNPKKLGKHGYGFSLSEKNGIVYTCKAGHIDISHLRIAADWTAYLKRKTYEIIKENKTDFSFRLNVEPSRCYIYITYPENWNELSQQEKEAIAHKVSVKVGEYAAYNIATWHEILTWFGLKCVAFLPEFASAFSWEDSFSNLLGTHLAAQVLSNGENDFDKAMTIAIEKELEMLDVQPRRIAKQITRKLRGKWFSGDLFFVNMKKRNFDIGLYDGYVIPTIPDDLSECPDAEPKIYPVPTLDDTCEYGFIVRFEIEPREWEKYKILKIVYPDKEQRRKRIEPAIHFDQLINHIENNSDSI